MMHQNLSFNRNTLKRTQYFTMNTGLTFSPLHLQQWVNLHLWENFYEVSSLFFFLCCFTQFPIEFIIHLLIHSEPSFLAQSWWKPLTYFSIVFRFNEHNSLCIETLHRPNVFRFFFFFFSHCSQQSLRASNIYTMIFFSHNNNNNHHYSFIHKSTKGWQQGRREVAQDGHHFTHDI